MSSRVENAKSNMACEERARMENWGENAGCPRRVVCGKAVRQPAAMWRETGLGDGRGMGGDLR